MRIGVTGGRDYTNKGRVSFVLYAVFQEQHTLIHGGATGADRLAADVANELGWGTEPHPANWGKYGNAAGPIRNQEMVDSGLDVLIAFPGGRGTEDMVSRAKRAGVLVLRVEG